MLRELQHHFRAAVTTPEDGVLGAHVDTPRGSIANRIDVYRTNVQASLTDALATAFPVTQRIVGPAFFETLAGAFVAARPPRAPQLSAYGANLPDFIATYTAARTLPYLPDVARLEWARSESYFAADAPVLDPAALQQIAPERIAELRFTRHPAVRLVCSPFPIARIWRANQTPDVPIVDMSGAESVLITRPHHEVIFRTLSTGDAVLIAELLKGTALGAAAAAATEAEPQLDLQAALAQHLQTGTFAALA